MSQCALDLRPEWLQELSPGCGLTTDLVKVTRSGCCGLESGEDQISTDVRNIIQAPEPNLMARGIAVDLLQVAKRVGPQCKATEHEDLSGEEGLSLDNVIVND